MGTTMTTPTTEVSLTRDAVVSLVKEAREQFENGVEELYGCGDGSQRPTITACTEIIGRMGKLISQPWRWPTKETPVGREEVALVDIEFSPTTVEWFKWDRDQQRGHIADLDSGMTGGDPGYHAEEVFLLHVLDGIVDRCEAVA